MDVTRTVLAVILLSVLPGGFGCLCLWMVGDQMRLHRRLKANPATSCRELDRNPFPGVAKVTGAAVAGPGGLLTGPISGEPCVWHAVKVVWYAVYEDSNGRRSSHTIYDEATRTPVGIDDGTATITVILPDRDLFYMSPTQAKRLVKSADVQRSNDNPPDLYGIPLRPADCSGDVPRHYQEWIVPPGADLTAMGQTGHDAEHGLVMRTSERQELVIAPETEAGLTATVRWHIRYFRIAAIILIVFAAAILVSVAIRPAGS